MFFICNKLKINKLFNYVFVGKRNPFERVECTRSKMSCDGMR